MNNLLEFAYAVSVATTQAITSFAQVRAQQDAVKSLSDTEVQQLIGKPSPKSPIGFNR